MTACTVTAIVCFVLSNGEHHNAQALTPMKFCVYQQKQMSSLSYDIFVTSGSDRKIMGGVYLPEDAKIEPCPSAKAPTS